MSLEFNDIRFTDDGQVTFLHLTPELLPAARALGGEVSVFPPPERPPHHLQARTLRLNIGAEALPDLTEEALWALHRTRPAGNGASLLDVKTELAWRLLRSCRLCARTCLVDRRAERGWCGLLGGSEVFGFLTHYGEEPPLVPSQLVYLSGCNYRCSGCQTGDDFDGHLPRRAWSAAELAGRLDGAYREGVWNANFLGGEPSLHLPYLLETVRALREPLQIVWNSNMHFGPEVSALLGGVVDYYLADLKFGNDACARQVARVTPYWETVTASIDRALAQDAQVIVRTLPLPGHEECCAAPIRAFLAGRNVTVSEGVYQPWWRDLRGEMPRVP